MINRDITRLIVPAIGCIFGVLLMVGIFSTSGNLIGQAAIYATMGAFVTGVIAPRLGVVVMLFLAAYSDLIKRFMVMESSISLLDLTYVLGMAPAALAGVVIACIVRVIVQWRLNKVTLVTFGISLLFLFVGVAMGVSAGGMKALRSVADYGAFVFLIFVLPILFPSIRELSKVARLTVFIFVPVALYGMWQWAFGLADFELDYLATGLSIESRQLGEAKIRPFSTLNAASSLTMVAAASVMLTLMCRKSKHLTAWVAALFIGIFSVACLMTLTRTGWVALVACIVFIPVFKNKYTTSLLYLSSVVVVAMVVLNSDYLLANLHNWQDDIYSSDVGDSAEQGLRITTLSDRLVGFSNMMDSNNWAPFGVEDSSVDFGTGNMRHTTTSSHDMISSTLFRFGYVPLSLAVLVFGGLLIVLHKKVFSLPFNSKRYCQLGLAAIMGLMTSFATGGYLFQFPSNIFFWLIVSLLIVAMQAKDLDGESGVG